MQSDDAVIAGFDCLCWRFVLGIAEEQDNRVLLSQVAAGDPDAYLRGLANRALGEPGDARST